MSGIYIEGLTIDDFWENGGDFAAYLVGTGRAISVPDHGRLIDADELCKRLLNAWHTADEQAQGMISRVIADVVTPIVVGTPTIIPADKGGNDGEAV